MTLYKFALIPKTCDKCDRIFIFERYFTYTRMMGIECHDVKFIECKNCHEKKVDTQRKFDPSTEVPLSNGGVKTCWKCGKVLTDDNRSNIVYTSDPPQYTCKDCDPPYDPSRVTVHTITGHLNLGKIPTVVDTNTWTLKSKDKE